MVRVIEPSVKIIPEYGSAPIPEPLVLERLELIGRTAYKSEANITPNSAERFIKMLINKGHLSVLEHYHISIRIICDRGVTHEKVRHRLVSYTQESTRYCNYKDTGITVIKPLFWDKDSFEYKEWLWAMEKCEEAYIGLINLGASPQQARGVLPNSLKTEIVATANVRQWRHELEQRLSIDCHPQIRQVFKLILKELQGVYPILFGSIECQN